jgi:molybdate transport system ATP-binding protein
VALARALASGPELLLLDEPLSGLDPAAKAELLPGLRQLLAGLHVPVLYVTHDAGEAVRVADRALDLRDGRVTEGAVRTEPAALSELPRETLERLAAAALNAGLA